MVHIKQAASVLALSASALAATINVAVSSVFNPDSITAAEGDIIQFDFESEHSVVRSDFSSPCVAASDNQIYSGTLSSVRDTTAILSCEVKTNKLYQGSFSVLVNSTDPLWLYCGYSRHCQGGQVMVVNPPSSGDQTLDAYRAAARSSGNSQNPDALVGGVLGTADQVVASPSTFPSSDASPSETATPSTPAESSAAAASSSVAASSSTAAAATGSSAANKMSMASVAGFAGVFAAFLA